jgi:hypothetical protein
MRKMVELAAAWAAYQPGFADALHAAIDGERAIGAPDFSPLTRKEYEQELRRFAKDISDPIDELKARDALRRENEAERDLAAVAGDAT